MAALRYLPYPVVAGFLAMIGAAVIMGAFKQLCLNTIGNGSVAGAGAGGAATAAAAAAAAAASACACFGRWFVCPWWQIQG